MLKHVYLALYFVYMTRTALANYDWTEVTTSSTKPSARNGHSSVLYDQQMVVFGGCCGYKNDVWALNLASHNWTEVTTSATKPNARDYHSSILYSGQMVIFGGWNGGSRKDDVWSLSLFSYD